MGVNIRFLKRNYNNDSGIRGDCWIKSFLSSSDHVASLWIRPSNLLLTFIGDLLQLSALSTTWTWLCRMSAYGNVDYMALRRCAFAPYCAYDYCAHNGLTFPFTPSLSLQQWSVSSTQYVMCLLYREKEGQWLFRTVSSFKSLLKTYLWFSYFQNWLFTVQTHCHSCVVSPLRLVSNWSIWTRTFLLTKDACYKRLTHTSTNAVVKLMWPVVHCIGINKNNESAPSCNKSTLPLQGWVELWLEVVHPEAWTWCRQSGIWCAHCGLQGWTFCLDIVG